MSQTFAWGDGTRDYLVASHIIKYGEFPKTGPYNLLDPSGIKNSPVYFYILALPLLFYQSPLTLGLLNIFLQMGVLILIYLIAKRAFNTPTALIALILFSFNPEIIKQADYIWQPYLMMPVALFSVYLFVEGYFKKNYKLIFLSVATITLAFAIHNSAFPWIVALLILSFLILRINHKSFKYFLALSCLTLGTMMFLYLPTFSFLSDFKKFPAQTIYGYLNNLNFNLDTFLNTFYVNKLFFILILVITTLLYYRQRNRFLIVAMSLFLLPILFASFFNKIRFHYILLSAPALTIILGYLLQYLKPKALKLVAMVSVLIVFSGNLIFIKEYKYPFENLNEINKISQSLILQLNQIKSDERFLNYDFFQVRSYAKNDEIFYYPTLDTILLVPLEKKFNQKLAATSDKSPYNHVQIGKKDYIVLACYKFQSFDFTQDNNSDCRKDFLKENLNYDVIKKIFSAEFISLYLAKQKGY